MNLPTKRRVILTDALAYEYIPMTRWIAGIHATHASMLMLLREKSGGWQGVAGVQFAATDTDDPEDWTELMDGSATSISTAATRETTTFIDITGATTDIPDGTDDYMWVRFGVGVKLAVGQQGTPARGEIEVSVQVRT